MKYFLSICTGFILGIVVSHCSLADGLLVFSFSLSVILFLDAKFFEHDAVKSVAFVLACVFFGIFFGQFRMLAFQHFTPHDLSHYESQKTDVTGEIVSAPISNGQTQSFTLSVSQVGEYASSTKASGKILVSTELFPTYHYGDILSVYGKIQPPEKFAQADGRVFDYPDYLLKDGITETMSFAYVKSFGENQGNPIIKFLYNIENHFVGAMQAVLPEPEAGLLAGIVLGAQTLSKNMSADFRTAGLSHIVVLSGYNITVVAESVMAVSLFFTPAYAFLISVIGVILFVLMSGAGASAVRAGIMSVVALIGTRFGKSYSAGRALFFACFVMILWNPMTLLFDPSFHLSVLATIAIIYMSPIVLQKLSFVTEKYGLREILATTLSAQIFVLPYILYISGNIQILGLPANMLILPFVPLTMLLGFFTGLFGLVSRFLGLLAGVPSYIILYYDIFIAQSISSVPFAQISIPDFSLSLMLIFYAGLFYFLYTKNRPTPQLVTSDGFTVIGAEDA